GWLLPTAARWRLRLQLVELVLVLQQHEAQRDVYALTIDTLIAGYLIAVGDLDAARPKLAAAREAILATGEYMPLIDLAREYVLACSVLPAEHAVGAILEVLPAYHNVTADEAILLVDAAVRGVVLCATQPVAVVHPTGPSAPTEVATIANEADE